MINKLYELSAGIVSTGEIASGIVLHKELVTMKEQDVEKMFKQMDEFKETVRKVINGEIVLT